MLLAKIRRHGRPRSLELGVVQSIVPVVVALLRMPFEAVLKTLQAVAAANRAAEVMKVYANDVVLEVLDGPEEGLLNLDALLLDAYRAAVMLGLAMAQHVIEAVEDDVTTRVALLVFFAAISDRAAKAAASAGGASGPRRVELSSACVVVVVVAIVHVAVVLPAVVVSGTIPAKLSRRFGVRVLAMIIAATTPIRRRRDVDDRAGSDEKDKSDDRYDGMLEELGTEQDPSRKRALSQTSWSRREVAVAIGGGGLAADEDLLFCAIGGSSLLVTDLPRPERE